MAQASGHSQNILCGQGGAPLAADGEEWPRTTAGPLFPILSVHTAELPFVPEFLVGAAYWSFFIEPGAYEHSVHDGSFVVRHHANVADLVPLAPPPACSIDPRLAFQFTQVTDYPCNSALREAFLNRPALLAALQARAEELMDRFPCHIGIKLGGYPHVFQGTSFLESLTPDFQIQLDMTDLYMYADAGIGFVYDHLSAVIWESM